MFSLVWGQELVNSDLFILIFAIIVKYTLKVENLGHCFLFDLSVLSCHRINGICLLGWSHVVWRVHWLEGASARLDRSNSTIIYCVRMTFLTDLLSFRSYWYVLIHRCSSSSTSRWFLLIGFIWTFSIQLVFLFCFWLIIHFIHLVIDLPVEYFLEFLIERSRTLWILAMLFIKWLLWSKTYLNISGWGTVIVCLTCCLIWFIGDCGRLIEANHWSGLNLAVFVNLYAVVRIEMLYISLCLWYCDI